MLVSDFNKIKSYYKHKDKLDKLHSLLLDFNSYLRDACFECVLDVPSVFFHHVEKVTQHLEEAYKLLFKTINEKYEELSDIWLQDTSRENEVPENVEKIGDWERHYRLKKLQKMKQFIDSNYEELKLILDQKRAEYVNIDHVIVDKEGKQQ